MLYDALQLYTSHFLHLDSKIIKEKKIQCKQILEFDLQNPIQFI